jgi:signal peptide peptidase SppA
MSDHVARAALTRMNMREIALAPSYTAAALAADLQVLATLSRDDAVKAHLDSRAELCAAYGMNVPEQRKPFAFANGFAIIPISGSLINRYSYSWGSVTGYNFIRGQLALALADDDVKGIIFDVNSYGGEAAGCFELAAEIRASRAIKPSVAVVDSAAYSAGYALASAASKLVLTPSGGVGSVGVITMHVDMSKALADWGIAVTLIYESEHKADGNPFEPLPESVKKNIEASIHVAYESFVALVAENRGMDAQKVRDTKSRTYRAEEALSLGLIDAIATPSVAVQAFSGELSGSTHQLKKEDNMSDNATKPGDQKAPENATNQATHEQAAADARKAERARVAGITGCEEAKGRGALATHLAMNTDMSVDEAKAILAVSPQEGATKPAAANGFKAAMDAGEHPNVGADATAAAAVDESAHIESANAILRAQQAATGRTPAKA